MLAMDETNMAWLQRKSPAPEAPRVELLTAAGGLADPEVPDPYYGPDEGFEYVLDLVERACDGVIQRLWRELPTLAGETGHAAGPTRERR
jgi:protein-tyrosine phosphatase